MNNYIDKFTIASRATCCANKKFYKSYIKNIELVERREFSGITKSNKKVWGIERDFTFIYKNKKYRINEYIKGIKHLSYVKEYQLQEL